METHRGHTSVLGSIFDYSDNGGSDLLDLTILSPPLPVPMVTEVNVYTPSFNTTQRSFKWLLSFSNLSCCHCQHDNMC